MTDYSKYKDAELIALFQNGDVNSEEAFRAIYSKYSPRIYAYCLRVLGNKSLADDIFQETFVRFYEKAKSSYDEGSVNGFLITIARNLCLNHKRDKKSNIPFEEYHLVNQMVINENTENREEVHKLITASLELLDFKLREPLVLRMYNGLSYKEIAEICNISVENARKRVFRAKQKIREILEPYYNEIY